MALYLARKCVSEIANPCHSLLKIPLHFSQNTDYEHISSFYTCPMFIIIIFLPLFGVYRSL